MDFVDEWNPCCFKCGKIEWKRNENQIVKRLKKDMRRKNLNYPKEIEGSNWEKEDEWGNVKTKCIQDTDQKLQKNIYSGVKDCQRKPGYKKVITIER